MGAGAGVVLGAFVPEESVQDNVVVISGLLARESRLSDVQDLSNPCDLPESREAESLTVFI
jgi:hypothetical protein